MDSGPANVEETRMRRMSTSRWIWLLAAAGAFLHPLGVEALRPGPQERPELERQLRERFEGMVARELGLDPGTAAQLREVSAEFVEPRRELSRRQRQLQMRMRSTGTILSEDRAREVLDELVAVKRDEVDLLKMEQERLLEILTPPQLVRFYSLREQFAQRIQRLRRDPGGGARPVG